MDGWMECAGVFVCLLVVVLVGGREVAVSW